MPETRLDVTVIRSRDMSVAALTPILAPVVHPLETVLVSAGVRTLPIFHFLLGGAV